MEVEPQLIRAAGVLCVAPNGHVLLVRRTDGRGWAFPGGGVEDGESAEDAARRELQEETGVEYEGDLILWTRRIQDGVDFTTFLARDMTPFAPKLNDEHDSFMWADRGFSLAASFVLHPGVPIALARFDMDELAVAKAIIAGDLTSPQRYANILLIALRITGTGASYRNAGKLDEYVWRDSSIYLNDEFLQRCNGLAVILEHAEGNMMSSEEYRALNIGSIFVPYIKLNEVWGIAKIMDEMAADILMEEKLSTSPAVLFIGVKSGERVDLENGSTLLIEGKPSLLDHLAICPRGVWDKGGAPAGVDSVDTFIESSPIDVAVHNFKLNELLRIATR